MDNPIAANGCSAIPAPTDLGLPASHGAWRKHQYETLVELQKHAGTNHTVIVSAPTGSGKTSWPAALAHDHRVIALSETKALQQQNYGDTYGFDYLFGKDNYTCALNPNVTAGRCAHRKEPSRCPHSWDCEYLTRKRAAMESNRCALNYAYFLTANWPRALAPSGFLVLDECHLLSEIVIEHASITLTVEQQQEYALPAFPQLSRGGDSLLFKSAVETEAIDYLEKCAAILERRVKIAEIRAERDKSLLPELEKAENLFHKVQAAMEALQAAPQDWFIRSGKWAREVQGHSEPGFVALPLTARHHFPRTFLHGGPTILMSATIGNFDVFAEELGIREYTGIVVPSQWAPEQRPVYVFEKAPSIGQKAGPQEYELQAQLIAEMLAEVPDTWSGVIHCTAIQQAHDLAGRLAQRGLAGRLWVPPRGGTDYQLQQWQQAKRRGKGKLAVAWSWWTGLDLGDEKVCIVAKVPYPFIGGAYERAKMQHNGKFYYQKTAWQLQQGCGRTRRGRPQDYDHDGQRAGLVAVVDRNWLRLRNYYDPDFRESLVQWD